MAIKLKLSKLTPKNKKQEEVFHVLDKTEKSMALIGYPGTGKTVLALYKAIEALNKQNCQQITIIRSSTPSEDTGFLPGSYEEKIHPYEAAYEDLFYFLTGSKTAYDELKEAGKLKFMNAQFIRGITIDNSYIVVDECQNLNYHQLRSIVTRVGENSRIIFCGDQGQTDLTHAKDKAGLDSFLSVIKELPSYFHISLFDKEEYIVRSGLVKAFICSEITQGLIK